jgi:hypothetical protein
MILLVLAVRMLTLDIEYELFRSASMITCCSFSFNSSLTLSLTPCE